MNKKLGMNGEISNNIMTRIQSNWFTISVYLGFLLWSMYWVISSWNWESDDRFFPIMFGSLLILFLCLAIIMIIFPDPFDRFTPEYSAEDENEVASPEETAGKLAGKNDLIVTLWVIILPIMIYFFGFLLVMPIYLALFLWYLDISPKTLIIVTLVFSVFMYLLFIEILGVIVWEGIYPLLG